MKRLFSVYRARTTRQLCLRRPIVGLAEDGTFIEPLKDKRIEYDKMGTLAYNDLTIK